MALGLVLGLWIDAGCWILEHKVGRDAVYIRRDGWPSCGVRLK